MLELWAPQWFPLPNPLLWRAMAALPSQTADCHPSPLQQMAAADLHGSIPHSGLHPVRSKASLPIGVGSLWKPEAPFGLPAMLN
jgi:hypothetical protein